MERRKNKTNVKKKVVDVDGTIVKVIWYDACSKNIDSEFLSILKYVDDGKELLEINETYGKLIKKSKNVIVLLNENSTAENKDITVIPRGWIKGIIYYKKEKQQKCQNNL